MSLCLFKVFSFGSVRTWPEPLIRALSIALLIHSRERERERERERLNWQLHKLRPTANFLKCRIDFHSAIIMYHKSKGIQLLHVWALGTQYRVIA